MAEDLIVTEGTTVVLDENPPASFAQAINRVEIKTLDDLVAFGAVDSASTLNTMLEAAQRVTDDTIANRQTYTPFVRIHGTTRPDLRRFGSFIAATNSVEASEREVFWRVVRGIDASVLGGLRTSDRIDPYVRTGINLLSYLFRDITVEPSSTLEIASNVQWLSAGNIVIRRGGRIVVRSSGVRITAFSIQGE